MQGPNQTPIHHIAHSAPSFCAKAFAQTIDNPNYPYIILKNHIISLNN